MKKLVYLSILLALVVGSFTVSAQVPEKPAQPDRSYMLGTASRAGIQDISGSFAAWDDGAYGALCVQPGTQTVCFNYHVQSATWAWPYGLYVKFPDGWTVANGQLLTYSCAAGGYPDTLSFAANGSEAQWNQAWYLASGWDACDAVYCVDVTAVGGGEMVGMPWYITSDGYGGGVVDTCDNSGYYACGEAVQPPAEVPPCQPGVYLNPPQQSGTACEGDTIEYGLNLYNNTGYDATFNISTAAVWNTTCPGSLWVANGATGTFTCAVSVPCGGGSDTATVSVYDVKTKYSDSALLNSSSGTGGWIDEPGSPAVTMDNAAIEWNGKLYVIDGYGSGGAVQIWDGTNWTLGTASGLGAYVTDACLGFDAAGNPVIDIFGDTSTFFNVWRYDINADSWASFAFPPGFPVTGLWAPDIVSMVQHTGENVCYISGGATAPGGGNTNALYEYHPDTGLTLNLGNYSYSPVGIDFHFSWWVPWVGDPAFGAICAAGGVDANSVVYGDTQCFLRLAPGQGIFNPPNADLGPLPQPWWGGADGWKEHEGAYQIWGYNGVDAAFALLQASFVSSGAGFGYGPVPLHAVYRLEGDHFAGSVWAANGSTGGFSPTILQEYLLQCPGCAEHFVHLNKAKMNTRPAMQPGWNKVIALGRVHDELHTNAAGIMVDGYWTYPDGSIVPGVVVGPTNNLGQFKFRIKEPLCGLFQFDITNMTGPGFAYDPAANEWPTHLQVNVPCK